MRKQKQKPMWPVAVGVGVIVLPLGLLAWRDWAAQAKPTTPSPAKPANAVADSGPPATPPGGAPSATQPGLPSVASDAPSSPSDLAALRREIQRLQERIAALEAKANRPAGFAFPETPTTELRPAASQEAVAWKPTGSGTPHGPATATSTSTPATPVASSSATPAATASASVTPVPAASPVSAAPTAATSPTDSNNTLVVSVESPMPTGGETDAADAVTSPPSPNHPPGREIASTGPKPAQSQVVNQQVANRQVANNSVASAPDSPAATVAARPTRTSTASTRTAKSRAAAKSPSIDSAASESPAPDSADAFDVPPPQPLPDTFLGGGSLNPSLKMALGVDEHDAEKPEKVVNFMLLSPQDHSNVGQVVDLVAQTDAPGYPVVLVRADNDDEYWWVQHFVARRNQYIAARVHFGNNDTFVGSPYVLTILMLDSAEEAVRFRAARQFKELPKGIRRSQVFHFVRQ
ncbi:MAG: hypothetical protein KDA38_10290 [Planctomycetales bacterium]|nr:hypothetical protein [Planctomycetales bacterium]